MASLNGHEPQKRQVYGAQVCPILRKNTKAIYEPAPWRFHWASVLAIAPESRNAGQFLSRLPVSSMACFSHSATSMKTKLLLLVVLGVLLASCRDTIGGKGAAEPEVAKFHEQLNAGAFEAIYGAAGSDFKNAAPKEKVLALFAAIGRKLGRYQSSKEINWDVRTFNLTTTAVLVYQTTFERGEATETFTYRISDGKAVLVGYNIGSLDMLIK